MSQFVFVIYKKYCWSHHKSHKKNPNPSQTITNHKFWQMSSLVWQSVTNRHKHKHTPSFYHVNSFNFWFVLMNSCIAWIHLIVSTYHYVHTFSIQTFQSCLIWMIFLKKTASIFFCHNGAVSYLNLCLRLTKNIADLITNQKKMPTPSQTITNHKFCKTSSLVWQSVTNRHKHKHTLSPAFVQTNSVLRLPSP